MASTVSDISTQHDVLQQARIDLAAVHRLSHRFGWDDGIYNHLTVTLPGRNDRFLVKSHGLLMSEVTASNLIVVDADGNTIEGDGFVETSALHIHAAIHLAAPAAACVLHVHPEFTTWLTSIEDNRLKMTHQAALRFHNRIAYDDEYGGLAMARDEGERMAAKLGNHVVMLHANHGVTTTGPTIAHAFTELYDIEKACGYYYRVVSSGAGPRVISDEIAELTASQYEQEYEEYVALSFAAWKRLLDKEEPDYAS